MGSFVLRGRHLFLYDVAVTLVAIVLAFLLRFDLSSLGPNLSLAMPVALLPLAVMPVVFVAFGLYRREWRYASVQEMYLIVFAVLVATAVSVVAFLGLVVVHFPGTPGYPRSIFALEALLEVAFVGGGRFAIRANLERRGISGGTDEELGRVPTIVYGAGETGATVARVAARDPAAHLNVVGFLDDDPLKQGSRLLGKRVFGGLDALPGAAHSTHARQLLVAMPTASGQAVRRAFERGQELGLEVRTVPHPRELVGGETLTHRIRRVSVDDLLRREPVDIDTDAVAGYLNGMSVLITGGGGSIGSELVRQILALGPRLITVVDNHEEALWSIERELAERIASNPGVSFDPVLADVRSPEAVDAVIARAQPEVVFHAAALKHVPIVELSPAEGVMTNVIGSQERHLRLRATRREEARAHLHRQGRGADRSHGSDQAPGRVADGRRRSPYGSAVRGREIRQRPGLERQRHPNVPAPAGAGPAAHDHQCRCDPLLHDHPRGREPHPPGRSNGRAAATSTSWTWANR